MIIIGEKINGTIPSVAAAVASGNDAPLRELAVRQAESGADYIDVSAGVNPDAELPVLEWLVDLVQSSTDTPVCVDSSNPSIFEQVLPRVKNRGLINSVSLESGKCEKIFPLARDLGWGVIALLCDDNGIPSTVERRLEIAKELLEKAADYGIDPARIFLDPLVIALSTDNASMSKFSACCQGIKAMNPDVHITSGLSNISFGLPSRKTINQVFLALAMSAGMDSAIMDPLDSRMLGAVFAADALLMRDKHIRKYTTSFRKGLFGQK